MEPKPNKTYKLAVFPSARLPKCPEQDRNYHRDRFINAYKTKEAVDMFNMVNEFAEFAKARFNTTNTMIADAFCAVGNGHYNKGED